MTTQATTPALPAVPPPYRAPHDPARVPEIVAALRKVSQLNGLEQAEYEWLANHGTEVFAESGAVVFREGDPATKMTILLQGEIYVRREHGGPAALFIGRSGRHHRPASLLPHEGLWRARLHFGPHLVAGN